MKTVIVHLKGGYRALTALCGRPVDEETTLHYPSSLGKVPPAVAREVAARVFPSATCKTCLRVMWSYLDDTRTWKDETRKHRRKVAA